MAKKRPRPGTRSRKWQHPYRNKWVRDEATVFQANSLGYLEELRESGIHLVDGLVGYKVRPLKVVDTDSRHRRPHHNLHHLKVFIPHRRSAQLRARQKRDGMRFDGEV